MKSSRLNFGFKAVIVLLFLLTVATPFQEANAELAGACEKGLAVCLASSLLEAGIPALWCVYAAWCFNGYAWCQAYVQPYL
ncbi:MAG TPA: hypothetical protein PKI81_09915 [bacterium]|nr:hypothetical protein [bacterium]